jgi:hypothetical protein
MDLIYTTTARVDEGILSAYELDLAFGSGENDFELQAGTKHILSPGQYIYIEGTEYGGIIDAIESDTATKKIVYSGRSWHGILNSKVLMPPAGADYLILNGDANTVLADLITTLGLNSLFVAETESSGIAISNYQMIRYIPAYNGILRMLKDNGAKLCMCYVGDMVKLAAQPITDYTASEDEFDSDILEFCAKKTVNKTNHLVCLGQGELAARTVVHLYADTDGNISTTQAITGADELVAIYENTQCETAAELQAEGIKRFKELLDQDDITIDFNEAADDYSVGDIVGAVDNVTGIAVKTEIKKKIVKIKDGRITVDLDTTSGSSKVSSGSFSGETSSGGGGGITLQDVFPIGSVHITAADINPATLFGFGTWIRVEGKMIMGASAQYPAGSTGGSATHTNTIDELVPHKHTIGGFPNGSPATWENPYGRIVYQTTSNNPYPAIAALINETGGGQPFSILNPYKAFYIWERVA